MHIRFSPKNLFAFFVNARINWATNCSQSAITYVIYEEKKAGEWETNKDVEWQTDTQSDQEGLKS